MKQFLPELMWVFRLLVSCLCGCVVGFERQRHIRAEHRKSAGYADAYDCLRGSYSYDADFQVRIL